MISYGFCDKAGRCVTLRQVDDENWRAVADIAPRDEQRRYVPALAARYLLVSMWGGVWKSLAVYADYLVVGHVMWGRDEDGSHWVGGMLIDGTEQGGGLGRAVVQTVTAWLSEQPGCTVIRLSYHPDNLAARRLYESVGFVATGAIEDGEVVAEMASSTAVRTRKHTS
jgi:diamine N-acetyltransferase